VFVPDVLLAPRASYQYEAARGHSHTLIVFDRATGQPKGFILSENLGYATVKEWMKAIGGYKSNAKPGYGHLESKSRGYGARLPSVRSGKANTKRSQVPSRNAYGYKLSAYDKAEMRQLGLDPSNPSDIRHWLAMRKKMLSQFSQETTIRGTHKPKTRPNRTRAMGIGSRVTVSGQIRMSRGRPIAGVFTIIDRLPSGHWVIKASDGLKMAILPQYIRSAKNSLEPGGSVELHSVIYKDRKSDDKKPELYEHEFGERGGKKPRLQFDGRNLKIKRAGAKYSVKKDGSGDSWIHD
jgi:hypothetical protein